jgi:hypothetical protein
MTGTTNKDKPFAPGETIDFCDDQYVVVANHGNSGTVREAREGGRQISPFYWSFEGADCRRVETIAA